jgi:hypothetical protein
MAGKVIVPKEAAMKPQVDELKTSDRNPPGKVLLDNETCTVLSLSEHPSLAHAEGEQQTEGCSPCPSYTTVPCSC